MWVKVDAMRLGFDGVFGGFEREEGLGNEDGKVEERIEVR